jgi:hypothetical protein
MLRPMVCSGIEVAKGQRELIAEAECANGAYAPWLGC